MKRKRGQRGDHKQDKTKIEPEQLISSESDSEPDTETDEMEINPQPEPEPKPENRPNPKPELPRPPVGQVVYSRVRVKIKSPASLPIEPHPILSENSNEQRKPQLEREDSGSPDLNTPKFGNTFSRKFSGIKIKTNKSLTPPSASASASGDTESNFAGDLTVLAGMSERRDEGASTFSGIKIKNNKSLTPPSASRDTESNFDGDLIVLAGVSERRNEAELNSALTVVRKIMRMEAAAPFNEPVDPIALGIPDYFDVIDTPMDFSMICKEIEQGQKYKNSEDVYRDVQLIWHNCYKYNNKGDYVIDLMRRVKKNFSKYWGAAGLSVSTDNTQTEGGQSGQAFSKSKLKNKKKKRSTMDHKSDCMCAVCTIRRRKLEKENPSVADTPAVNTEEKSASEVGASSMDHSPGPDHIEHNSRRDDNTPPNKGTDNQLSNGDINNSNSNKVKPRNNQAPQFRLSENDESQDTGPTSDEELEYKEKDGNGDNVASSHPKETYKKFQPPKKKEVLMENHAVLELCKSIFTDGNTSRRSGLFARKSFPVQDNPIRSAVASLLK